MQATPVSVLALAPSRGAALPVLRGRSSLPPAAYRMRRGSPRPERSRLRGDDGWLGATRQSVILAILNTHNSHTHPQTVALPRPPKTTWSTNHNPYHRQEEGEEEEEPRVDDLER